MFEQTEDEAQVELPSDRELALNELNLLVAEIKSRNANAYVRTHKAWLRERIVGWMIFAILAGGLGYVLFYQYANAQELRQSLYEVCITNTGREDSQRALYQRLADTTESVTVRRALLDAVDQIEPRDCRGAYLTR